MACRNCGAVSPEACALVTTDTDCWDINGAGTKASPFTVTPNFDPDGTNLASCSAVGLLAQLPYVIAYPPACQVYHTANVTITTATLTALNFNSETYDTDLMHSVSALTSRITIKTSGKYVITFVCSWDKNITGDRKAYIRKNGTDYLAYDSKPTGGADLIVGHSLVVQDAFVATDYLEGVVYQDSGAGLRILAEEYSPRLSAVLV